MKERAHLYSLSENSDPGVIYISIQRKEKEEGEHEEEGEWEGVRKEQEEKLQNQAEDEIKSINMEKIH